MPKFDIPGLLVCLDGEKIADTGSWRNKRRPEILKLFSENVYGITPDIPAIETEYRIAEANERCHGGKNSYRLAEIVLKWEKSTATITAAVYTPNDGEGPYPAIVMIDPFLNERHRNEPAENLYSFFPPDIITDRGYAAVQVICSTVCPDDPKRYKNGVLGRSPAAAFPENDTTWGSIGAWAWAASRCLDYLISCGDIDGDKVAVTGCSRGGKTSLWAGAQDERFAIVMSNVSGCSGAALTRGKTGEHIKNITDNFPYWFCRKYASYADDEESMPFDQHMLIALAAPRPVYLASASEDVWADIDAEYRAYYLAKEIYDLYDLPVHITENRPGTDSPVLNGYMGYHLREGFHGLFPYDWYRYMDFCDLYFK